MKFRQGKILEGSWIILEACLGLHLYYKVKFKVRKGHWQQTIFVPKKIVCLLQKLESILAWFLRVILPQFCLKWISRVMMNCMSLLGDCELGFAGWFVATLS